MKKRFLKTLFSLGIYVLFCLSLLITFLLSPSLLYAHQTTYENITIYHNTPLDENLRVIIDLSLSNIESAAIYQEHFKSDLCLNDGSFYPKMVQNILGDDVFIAFSNKVVVLGQPLDTFNRFEKWGQILRSDQFLSHAFMHNLQFKKHGLFGSNPLARHPNWKWEGYVEYEIMGKNRDLKVLLYQLQAAPKDDFSWIDLGEYKKTVKAHLQYLVLTKYCFEVLGMDYEQFMSDDRTATQIEELLLDWSNIE